MVGSDRTAIIHPKAVIKLLFALAVIVISVSTGAQQVPIEIHDRLAPQAGGAKSVALTLDACSGKFDDDLVEFLIRNRTVSYTHLTLPTKRIV